MGLKKGKRSKEEEDNQFPTGNHSTWYRHPFLPRSVPAYTFPPRPTTTHLVCLVPGDARDPHAGTELAGVDPERPQLRGNLGEGANATRGRRRGARPRRPPAPGHRGRGVVVQVGDSVGLCLRVVDVIGGSNGRFGCRQHGGGFT